MATFASTANEIVAKAVSTEDNPPTADEAVATLASTVDKTEAKAASTAGEDVATITSRAGKPVAEARGRFHSGRGVDAARGHRLMHTRRVEAARAQERVFPFLCLYFILTQFSF